MRVERYVPIGSRSDLCLLHGQLICWWCPVSIVTVKYLSHPLFSWLVHQEKVSVPSLDGCLERTDSMKKTYRNVNASSHHQLAQQHLVIMTSSLVVTVNRLQTQNIGTVHAQRCTLFRWLHWQANQRATRQQDPRTQAALKKISNSHTPYIQGTTDRFSRILWKTT